jgi:transcriptional regulator with XRE-family HTH domain
MLQALSHSHADLIFLSAPHNPPMDSMEKDRLALGKRIADLRESKGWTQTELAANATIAQPSLWSIEKGKTVEITARTLIALARALGTTWEYLWEGSEVDTAAEAELLACYRSLSSSSKGALMQSARTLVFAEKSSANDVALKDGARNENELTDSDEVGKGTRKASGRTRQPGSTFERNTVVRTKPDVESRPAKGISKPRAR